MNFLKNLKQSDPVIITKRPVTVPLYVIVGAIRSTNPAAPPPYPEIPVLLLPGLSKLPPPQPPRLYSLPIESPPLFPGIIPAPPLPPTSPPLPPIPACPPGSPLNPPR